MSTYVARYRAVHTAGLVATLVLLPVVAVSYAIGHPTYLTELALGILLAGTLWHAHALRRLAADDRPH